MSILGVCRNLPVDLEAVYIHYFYHSESCRILMGFFGLAGMVFRGTMAYEKVKSSLMKTRTRVKRLDR